MWKPERSLESTAADDSYPEIARDITFAIKSVVGAGPVPLHEPRFSELERQYLLECIDSTYVSSVGPFVTRFESSLTAYTGSPYAVAVVNGTEALHVALLLADTKPNDEVLVPAMSFIATANAVTYCNAVPHFVDIEQSTLGIDAGALSKWLKTIAVKCHGGCRNRQTGRRIKALIPMHAFGHPSDLDGLMAVAREFGLSVVEDAAEGLGSFYQGMHVGTVAELGVLSFNGNKVITTGGGGAILTSDATVAARARHLTTTARRAHQWEFVHDDVGFNYRMPGLNAAIGCAQMTQLPQLLESKRRLANRYEEAFAGIRGVTVFSEPAGTRSNYWLQTILLDKEYEGHREAILERTNVAGLSTRPAWRLIPDQSPYNHTCPRAPLPAARSLQQRLINIPSSAFIV